MEILAQGATLAGKYQVETLLAQHAYCNVYLARESVYHRLWMLKQFPIPEGDDPKKEFLDHFYAEGERQSAVVLDALPRVDEFFAEKGCAWTVTEHVTGTTLAAWREAQPTVSEETVKGWALALAEAIAFLHGLEPRFVLGGFDREALVVTEGGQIRLTDYGIARIYPPSRRQSIPPEALPRWFDSEMLAHAKATRQADIWSVGAMCYFLLTGVDARHENRKALTSLNPQLSASFSAVVERCLEPFGDTVYTAIEEVIDELGERPARDRALPPRLTVIPARLDLAGVTAGAIAVDRIRIVNEGGGTIAGHVDTSAPWLQVNPRHFEGNEQEVQVWADTSMLYEDVEAKGYLTVTSASEELRVPVCVGLQLGRVGGLPPRLGAVLMLLLALVPLGLVIAFDGWALTAAAVLTERVTDFPSAPQADPLWRSMRAKGSFLLAIRLALSVIVPVAVYGLWRTLATGARRRTTLAALAAMLSPALVTLVWVRLTEGTFASSTHASWFHLAPSLGLGGSIVATVVATVLLMTPGSRYPSILGQSPGLRAGLAVLLAGVYAWSAWLVLAR